jgi:hypothetical protein
MYGVEGRGKVDRSSRQERTVIRAPHRTGKVAVAKEAGAPGLIQVAESLVEVVACEVAEYCLNGLIGAPAQSRDYRGHMADGVAALRRTQVQNGDRLVGGRQRQFRDGGVNPIPQSLDRRRLRPRMLIVITSALHSRCCWHVDHLSNDLGISSMSTLEPADLEQREDAQPDLRILLGPRFRILAEIAA